MSTNAPFTPSGNTVTFTAATTAPTPIQAVSTTLGGNQYRVVHAGGSTVFLGVGSTAAQATAASASISSTGNSIPILANTTQVLTLIPNAYFTGNAATNSVIYVTPGDGFQ